MIAPSLRLVAAVAAGAHLVGRPRSGVLHVYTGPLTPSGRFAAAAGRTVCRARTRRLSVIEQRPSLPLDLAGRRVCRRCMPLLPTPAAEDHDKFVAAFGHLSPGDVRRAAVMCRTVDETYQVGRAALLHGAKPSIRDPRLPAPVRIKTGRLPLGTPEQQDRWLMHTTVEEQRRALVAAQRTAEERDAVARAVEVEALDRRRTDKARRDEAARDKALEKQRAGVRLLPWEERYVS